MIRVGIIGLGYWGPHLVRNFAGLPDSEVTAICDLDPKRLEQLHTFFPRAYATKDAAKVLTHKMIDAAVIATPTRTHYALAGQALRQGLHSFVEKPLATSPEECDILIRLAEKKGVVLFVGHVFLYASAVIKLKELIDNGHLGNLCYISSTRLNLGPVRQDVNALWDLAPHDISIILNLMGKTPVSVNCQGLAYLNKDVHDVCALELHFEDRGMALVHVSWLDPNKTRRMTVVGDKRMAIYDDIEPLEKIKIYDKGIDTPSYSHSFGEFQFSYRYGDTSSPWLKGVEPLQAECQHFIQCIQSGKTPKTDGRNGLEVVKVLAAAECSLQNGGGRVKVEEMANRHNLDDE